MKNLSMMVRTNASFISLKLKKINKKLDDTLKTIETMFIENNKDFKSFQKKLEDFGKLLVAPKKESKARNKKMKK